jgi:hypothetical protein
MWMMFWESHDGDSLLYRKDAVIHLAGISS